VRPNLLGGHFHGGILSLATKDERFDVCDNHLMVSIRSADVSKFPPDAHTRRLQFLSCVYQLEQLINEPTRATRTSATLIDLIFANKKENIVKSGLIHLGIYPITV
jgi:hypothetical protein